MTEVSKLATLFLLCMLSASHQLSPQLGVTTFEFSFSNPGARSLGFGGAFGIWLDPDHHIQSLADDDPIARAFFRAGDDELHGALGVGIVFERFQIDFGIDLSELVKSASLSEIFSF